MNQVHPCARTTPRTRAEINASPAGASALASLYNIPITTVTARKWKGREDSEDRSHRAPTLRTVDDIGAEDILGSIYHGVSGPHKSTHERVVTAITARVLNDRNRSNAGIENALNPTFNF